MVSDRQKFGKTMKKNSVNSSDLDWLKNYHKTVSETMDDGFDQNTAIEISLAIVNARIQVEPYCGRRAALEATVTVVKTVGGRISASVDIDLSLVPQHLQSKVRKHPSARG